MSSKVRGGQNICKHACEHCKEEFWGTKRARFCSHACKNKSRQFLFTEVDRRLHSIWHGMKGRCYRKTHSVYGYYGARGITVCEAWHRFDEFRKWALANGYAQDLTLDRKEGDKNYCPENCRWATYQVQIHNRRVIEGKEQTSKYFGVSWYSPRRKWQVNFDGRGLGHFSTEEEAARAYDKASRIKHGIRALLNFPDETTSDVCTARNI